MVDGLSVTTLERPAKNAVGDVMLSDDHGNEEAVDSANDVALNQGCRQRGT